MGKAYLVNELNNATFTNDILEDAVFFMFAEGGAMGEPGGILFVTEDGEVYHGNYAFGDLEMDTVVTAVAKENGYTLVLLQDGVAGWVQTFDLKAH